MRQLMLRFGRALVAIWLATLLPGATGSANAAALCDRPAESTTEIGKVASPNITLTPGTVRPPYRSQQIDARYYMLHFVPGPAMTGDWSLTLRDTSYHVLDVLGPDDFKGENKAGRWTGRLLAPEIVFDLFAAPGSSGIALTLDEAIIMPEDAINPRYSLQGQHATYESLYAFQAASDDDKRIKRSGDRVGFLIGSGPTAGGQASWCCSGVMLTRDLYLTNWHCGAPTGVTAGVWTKDRCTTTLLDLSWDEDGVSSEFTCAKVAAKSEDLDYAVLRVAPIAGPARNALSARALAIAAQRPADGSGIRIVHHAECKRKLLSKGCRVIQSSYKNWRSAATDTSPPTTEFTHDCDTEGGSSGAPIFDAAGALLGLHHLGFGKISETQCDRVNKAVHIMEILEDIKRQDAGLHSEITGALAPN